MRSRVFSGYEQIKYSMKTIGSDEIKAKHTSSYMYICPKCGRHAEVNTKVEVSVDSNMETANFGDFLPTHEISGVYIVPSEGISLQCSCGCGMIAVDSVCAKIAFKFRNKFGFKDIVIPEPFAETGLSFLPSEISFMDSFKSERMQKLLGAIYAIESDEKNAEKFKFVVTRVKNDELGFALPIREICAHDNQSELENAYITITELSPDDCVRYKNVHSCDSFIEYMELLEEIMGGEKKYSQRVLSGKFRALTASPN